MSLHDQHLTWEQFEQKFRAAFDRDMTPAEDRWFHAIWEIVHNNEQGKSKGAAA